MDRLDHERYCAALEAEAEEFAATVRDADPALMVPTCPEWTLGQLIVHVGAAHRWVGAIVDRRATTSVPFGEVEDFQPPEDARECAQWLLDGAVRLAGTLRKAGPWTRVWSWTEDQSVGFWARRMVHETAVHRADAAITAGRAFELAADLAADGISEWLAIVTSPVVAAVDPARAARLHGDGQTLHFHATDPGLAGMGEWLVRRTPSGVIAERALGAADVTIRGSAVGLLLTLMRRRTADGAGIEIEGDETLLAHRLEHTSF